ncbi:hypothetical protein IGI04_008367 [Brassica rapa subsp. trilocularis]|uniref:Uncharacterized protein n=1 Tax=Brassica rapa subsp. trilocularis TaxID=1813537 RepID=A0ABQ7NMP5_BRACM|nr:hypothetical protein IGI04_008367 [Brassica rapa subsp. trilocularis]
MNHVQPKNREHNAPLCRGTNVCYSVFYNLANKLDEKLVLTGYEHKVIVATNINPKLVGASTKYGGVQKLESVTVAKLNAYVLNSEPQMQPQLFSSVTFTSNLYRLMIPMSSITGSRYLCTLEVVKAGLHSTLLQNIRLLQRHGPLTTVNVCHKPQPNFEGKIYVHTDKPWRVYYRKKKEAVRREEENKEVASADVD